METATEAREREEAEAKADPGRGNDSWAAKYKHLRLSHTMLVHKKKKGKQVQFEVLRRAPRGLPKACLCVFSSGLPTGVFQGTAHSSGSASKSRTRRNRIAWSD